MSSPQLTKAIYLDQTEDADQLIQEGHRIEDPMVLADTFLYSRQPDKVRNWIKEKLTRGNAHQLFTPECPPYTLKDILELAAEEAALRRDTFSLESIIPHGIIPSPTHIVTGLLDEECVPSDVMRVNRLILAYRSLGHRYWEKVMREYSRRI